MKCDMDFRRTPGPCMWPHKIIDMSTLIHKQNPSKSIRCSASQSGNVVYCSGLRRQRHSYWLAGDAQDRTSDVAFGQVAFTLSPSCRLALNITPRVVL